MRGLKLVLISVESNNGRSHPSWVRGLKRFSPSQLHLKKAVAPLVGAWIETLYSQLVCRFTGVAPLVGAWIETESNEILIVRKLSHPSWVRGLKLKIIRVISFRYLSHPSWVRGLKQYEGV